jgi:hypothetical protein
MRCVPYHRPDTPTPSGIARPLPQTSIQYMRSKRACARFLGSSAHGSEVLLQLGPWTGRVVDVADLVYDVGSVVAVSWLVLLLLLPWYSLTARRWRALASHRRRHASLRPLSRPAALQYKFSWQVRRSLRLSAY